MPDGEYDKMIDDLTEKLDRAPTEREKANATILYVASKAESMKKDGSLDSVINDPGSVMEDIMGKRNDPLTKAALLYGTMTAYGNSKYASETFKNTLKTTDPKSKEDLQKLFVALSDDEKNGGKPKDYLKADDKGAKADMTAYLGALQIINDSKEKYGVEFNISSENAFNDDQTLALLQGILNSKK